MTHAKNKVKWCLRKAEPEGFERHRGLVKIQPNKNKARAHIAKAEHYLKATDYLKKGDFTDLCTSTIFYSIYHCLLAIAAKFGYESRNQECTFALIYTLIEDGLVDIDVSLINKIASLDVKNNAEKTTAQIREEYQYGTSLSIKDGLYIELFELAKDILSKTKVIIEE